LRLTDEKIADDKNKHQSRNSSPANKKRGRSSCVLIKTTQALAKFHNSETHLAAGFCHCKKTVGTIFELTNVRSKRAALARAFYPQVVK
jgi:hypothetical protein